MRGSILEKMSEPRPFTPAHKFVGASLIIGVVLLFALAGVLVYRLFYEDDYPAPPIRPRPKAVQLTQQQEASLSEWGRKIASLASEDLGQELSPMHDRDAIAALVLDGIDGKEVRQTLDEAIRFAVSYKAGGFLAQACGHPVHFLRVCTRAGFPAVTLRVDYENGLIGYMDVLLQPAGRQFKIIDVYNYLSGECRTEDFRCNMVAFFVARHSEIISKWLDSWNLKKEDAEYLLLLIKARRKGDEEEILAVCDQAPGHLRNNRLVFFTRTQVLQRLSISNPRYERLSFEAMQNPPRMPENPHVLELMLIPKLLASFDYQTADDAVGKVMAVIGDDAYLMCLRAEIKFNLMDMEAARALLRRAAELEPDLPLLEEKKRELKFPQKSEC